MLPRVAALSLPAPLLDRRNASRRTFTLSFDATERPGTTPVSILDLSQTGMRISSTANLELGEYLEVALPQAGTVSAIVVRIARGDAENEYGTEFLEPISQGAVSAALLAAPPLSRPQLEQPVYPEPHVEKLGYRTRLVILGGLTVTTWLLVGAAGYMIARAI
ncbi:PilZ domain-containing protein [Aurantiacibacter suaedae]|uniref:PilZ domain-containing protein n=1 Tax=Aurantiacibacter suaedae TaxID=2545755 RepID=UPI0010F55A6F|nr:PilZ domain-containing protein [Aurantiacibacter suaedae]